ncbi:helix-turn-helix domain-containing protein [Streptomyces parvus]|uniref:helix-turn-helix domain-containing protein n=1 Tax=Streptomyces parvus TaxID=66428 RepID=UPI0021007933|nr:helix-turn-helix transcriptional regulator [Streptomyces parvus]MCQ1577135.1 helix-turn-helix domain-containing protein [Streptomyces parvus]
MTTSTPASVPCAPSCDAPSLPPVLVGALMRHHRTRAGLSQMKAGHIIESSASRISDLETARTVLPVSSAHALLNAYGTPAPEIRQALALLALPDHQHRIDCFAPTPAWVDALIAGSRSVHVYSADPASLSHFSPASSPALGVPGGRPSTPRRCRMVLLLSESLLNLAWDGHPAAAHLPHLLRLAENGAISVHLVPGQLDAHASLLAEYTYTVRGWNGTVTDRLRRQIFVAHHDGAPGSVGNGGAAAAERQLLQQAARIARPLQWSLHQLRQAARAQQQDMAVDGPRAAFSRPVSSPDTRTRRTA